MLKKEKRFRNISIISGFIACLPLWGTIDQTGIIWDFLFGFGVFCLATCVISGIINVHRITDKLR